MSALGCFGRFTLFSPRVSHSNTCRLLSFVCFVLLFGFVALVCFCFLFCECLGIPNSPRSLDLDDRQGLIARSAMQQKKKKCSISPIPAFYKRKDFFFVKVKDSSKSYVFLHDMRFGIGFGIGFGMDSEWIRNGFGIAFKRTVSLVQKQ